MAWPLLLACALHGLVLAWAALATFSRTAERAEEAQVFEVTLARAQEPPRPEPEFEHLEFEQVEEVLEPSLPDVFADEFLEPEMKESEVWNEVVVEPEEPPPPALSSVDFTPPDSGALGDLKLTRGRAGGSSSGGPGTGIGVGSGGVRAPVGAGMGDGTGAGRNPGPPAGASPSSAPILRVEEAAALETPPPAYPRLSQRAGEEGSVLCRLHISARGTVTAVDVVETSGHARLDDAAKEALLRWRFRPRSEGGRPVETTLQHRVVFRLEPAGAR